MLAAQRQVIRQLVDQHPRQEAHVDRALLQHRKRRRRKKVVLFIAVIALLGLIWVIIESSRALTLF